MHERNVTKPPFICMQPSFCGGGLSGNIISCAFCTRFGRPGRPRSNLKSCCVSIFFNPLELVGWSNSNSNVLTLNHQHPFISIACSDLLKAMIGEWVPCAYIIEHGQLPPSQSFCGYCWVASQNGFHWTLDSMTQCARIPSRLFTTKYPFCQFESFCVSCFVCTCVAKFFFIQFETKQKLHSLQQKRNFHRSYKLHTSVKVIYGIDCLRPLLCEQSWLKKVLYNNNPAELLTPFLAFFRTACFWKKSIILVVSTGHRHQRINPDFGICTSGEEPQPHAKACQLEHPLLSVYWTQPSLWIPWIQCAPLFKLSSPTNDGKPSIRPSCVFIIVIL